MLDLALLRSTSMWLEVLQLMIKSSCRIFPTESWSSRSQLMLAAARDRDLVQRIDAPLATVNVCILTSRSLCADYALTLVFDHEFFTQPV